MAKELANQSKKRRLGDFEIIRELGRGGMGIVYEARQRSLNRKVALKVLSSGLGMTAKAVIRFRREAETAAKLHHTNIVPIHATGEEDGVHYYAMELVDGPSLNFVIRHMRDHRRSAEPKAQTPSTPPSGSDSTVAVSPRHAAPAASLEDPATSLPDWVAQTMTMESGSDPIASGTSVGESSSTLTAGHSFFDNIARMIADVADALGYAHSQTVVHRDMKPSNLLLSPDGRVSINDFGLARMLEQPGMTTTGEFMGSPLYMSPEQITAGRAPLDHRTDIYSLGATLYELLTLQPPFLGERRDQIIGQIMHKEPRSLRSVNKKIPVDLETICLKAMEKDPDRRYQTGEDMAEDLRRFVNRFAISARQTGIVGRTSKWVRRHRALSAALTGAFLLGGVASLSMWRAHVQQQRYEVRLQEERRGRAIDDALAAAMSGDLDGAERAASEAELHGAIAWARMLRGQVAHYRGDANEALEHLKAAVSLDPTSMTAKAMLASASVWAGDWHLFEQTVEQMNQAPPVTAEDYLFRGTAELHYDIARAMESLEVAKRLRPRSGVVRTAHAEALAHLAWDTFDLATAHDAIEESRTAKEMLPGNPAAILVSLFSHVVAARIAVADEADARRFLDEGQADARALEGFPEFLAGYTVRAHYYESAGDQDLALELWRQAVQRGGGGYIAEDFAGNMFRRQRSEEALELLNQLRRPGDRSLDMARAYLTADFPTKHAHALGICRTLVGPGIGVNSKLPPLTILLLLGQREEVRQLSLDSLKSLRTSRMRRKSIVIEALSGRRSFESVLAELGSSKKDEAITRHVIAVDLLSQGRREEARSEFQKSASVAGGINALPIWSRAYYERLSADPTWPPWIPMRKDDGAKNEAEPTTVNGGDE